MILVFVGAPGAGKGTQASLFIKEAGFTQLSTGDMFRDLLKNGKDDFASKVKKTIESGKLVSDKDTSNLLKINLKNALAKSKDKKIILDGYPRTVKQTKDLKEILNELKEELHLVVEFKIDETLLIDRLTNRRVCPNDGTTYHLKNMPPKIKGICDICGTKVIQRADDTEEKIKVRLETYHVETEPIINIYKKEGKLLEVNGSRNSEVIFKEMKSKLNI